MRGIRVCVLAAIAAMAMAAAPVTQAVPGPDAPPVADPASSRIYRYWGHVVRVGQDYTLRAGERVGEVFVAFGTVRIDGRIDRSLVVVFGDVVLGPTAEIDGSLGVFGGRARAEAGARVRRDVVTIGADLETVGPFVFNREHIVIGTGALGDVLRGMVPWFTYGLLWGRPIVASLPWVWTVVGVFFLIYAFIALVAPEPVRASSMVIRERPFGAFLAGLLVMLLWAPAVALLGVSVVGIIIIPFFLCALVVAAVVGRVGVAHWIGSGIVSDDEPTRVTGLRSFVIGFVMLTLTYMVPVLGLMAWGLVGVFGLGAATLAFLAAWRRETPKATADPVPTPRAPSAPFEPSAPLAYAAPAAYSEPVVPPAYIEPPVAPAPPPLATPLAPSASGVRYASFLERAAAFLLDVLLLGVTFEVLEGVLFWRMNDDGFPLIGLAYFIVMWAWKGTTVGGMIMKIRVVKADGRPFEAPDAVVRGLAGVLSFAAIGLGVLWILRDPESQAWHDKAVGTWVIKE